MARYRKIDPRIWNDAKFRTLSDNGKLLFFFILTHPFMTALGGMRATVAGMAEELGWTLKAFREAFREGIAKGLYKYDEKALCLVVPKFIKYNPPESANVVKAWASSYDLIPESNLKTEQLSVIKGFLEGFHKGFLDAFDTAFPKATLKPMPNQEQEQEQEQDIPPLTPPGGGNGKCPSSFSLNSLAEEWNHLAPKELSRVNLPFSRSTHELKKLTTVIKRHPEKEWWISLFEKIATIPGLLGENDRGWRLSFDDAVLKSEKIMDGKYDNWGAAPKVVSF